jgi:perosamine synthetase
MITSDNEIFMAGPNVTEEDIKIVVDALRNGWYGINAYQYVEKFEKEFAEWHGRKFALMTPNCTQAIHLLLAALDIKKGDEVIVPDSTWIASAAPIVYLGATPIFADVDEHTWCLSEESIRAKISNRTKAVIVVDLYGNMPNMAEIKKVCKEFGIYMIEDAAEALGSKIGSERAGSFGVGSVFSFHRTKTLTTGEGGMLLIDDEKIFQRCKFLRDHGRAPGGYYNLEVTFKYMPSNLAASLGYAQFLRINDLVNKKRWIWKTYFDILNDTPDISLNPIQENVTNSFWSTVLLVEKKSGFNSESLMEKFKKFNIPVRPFFYPLSSLPAFAPHLPNSFKKNKTAYSLSNKGMCLPSSLNLSEAQINFICATLKDIISK